MLCYIPVEKEWSDGNGCFGLYFGNGAVGGPEESSHLEQFEQSVTPNSEIGCRALRSAAFRLSSATPLSVVYHRENEPSAVTSVDVGDVFR